MSERTVTCDVAIVGGGPAGLGAATELIRLGVERVVVLEREAKAGGIPRHCLHSPFGLREFGRLMRGPAYAECLADTAARAGAEIRLGATVTALEPGGSLAAVDHAGPFRVEARRVLLATGAREASRAARLVTGARPLGIVTTGALQAMVHLKKRKPFERPLVVGSELVSFSALLTCRSAGIRPAAMIEAGPRTVARWPSRLLPLALGVPLLFESRITAIRGTTRVESVDILQGRRQRTIECDGVLFTGAFLPEASLARLGPLAVDRGSGGPSIDQFGRCSDGAYFAAGNLLRPVETAGQCWREGVRAARAIAADLAGELPAEAGVPLAIAGALRYAVPQRIVAAPAERSGRRLQIRVPAAVKGRLTLSAGKRILWSRRIDALPERRILLPLPDATALGDGETFTLTLTPQAETAP
ncbi:FAD-dependent oxidoreductase [Zavarzinia sp.]|uniref:FAD-dependent oxidoreductase n=1 Tax=Zavarzinia sp. TaxID=2027920 RepID=UPI003566D18F